MPDCLTCLSSTNCNSCTNLKYVKSDKTGCIIQCELDPNGTINKFFIF